MNAHLYMLTNLYMLLACHMIGDYVLQTDFLAKTKGDNWWHLFAHCVTYTMPFAVAFGVDWRIAWLLVTHALIDAAKARYKRIGYVTDQVAHVAVMLVCLIFQ